MESLNKPNVSLTEFWPVMKEVIDSDGEFAFYPNGTSMLPLIRQGVDQVILVKANDIKKGDVVLYLRDNGQFVLHRIVKVKKGEYVMCGDNQFDLEYGITDKHILAKMKSFIRDEQTIDDTNKKYRRYIKRLPCRRFRKRLRNLLGRIKRKIFKKKTA